MSERGIDGRVSEAVLGHLPPGIIGTYDHAELLPQRREALQWWSDELGRILADFKSRATEVGIQQFIVQTHVESPMELTPESRTAFQRLRSAGWMVTNQLVFTASASRRGHTAKLRFLCAHVVNRV